MFTLKSRILVISSINKTADSSWQLLLLTRIRGCHSAAALCFHYFLLCLLDGVRFKPLPRSLLSLLIPRCSSTAAVPVHCGRIPPVRLPPISRCPASWCSAGKAPVSPVIDAYQRGPVLDVQSTLLHSCACHPPAFDGYSVSKAVYKNCKNLPIFSQNTTGLLREFPPMFLFGF